MTTERYMAHVVRPVTLNEAAADRISWRNLGRGERDREPMPRDPRLCDGENKYGHLCCAWGSYRANGRLYCVAHRPVDGAERR